MEVVVVVLVFVTAAAGSRGEQGSRLNVQGI